MTIRSNSDFGTIELEDASKIEEAWELYKTTITDPEADIETLHEEFVDSFEDDKNLSFQVIEDNGGGLALFIFNNRNKVIYSHTGYEYVNGQLEKDIEALSKEDVDISEWDGCGENPQEDYKSYTANQYGWNIVLTGNIGNLSQFEVYLEHMGAAARLEVIPFIVNKIYSAAHGGDDKYNFAGKSLEIQDWLCEGTGSATIEALISEWQEYDE